MKVNNVELQDLDMYDLETAEKVEGAINKLESCEVVDGKSLSETIKAECNRIFDFFNDIWGQGTDKKVFGNKTNVKECYKAFNQVLENLEKSKQEIEAITYKYSPNRAKRRR